MSGARDISEKEGARSGRCSRLEHDVERSVLERLVLVGESEPMQRLRRQVQVMAPYLRGAIVEAESGLGGEILARDVYRLSGAGHDPLWSMDAATHDGLEQVNRAEMQSSVLLRGLPGATPTVQRRLLELMRGSRAGRGPTRWLVLMEHSVKVMIAQGHLLPEVARALPAVTLRLTPLRERREDIGKLAAKALELLGGGTEPSLDGEVMNLLEAHQWTANLEELVRSLQAWRLGQQASAHDLATILLRPRKAEPYLQIPDLPEEEPALLQRVIDRHLLRVMRRCGGNKLRAAETLGISRSTLYRMLEAISAGERRAEMT